MCPHWISGDSAHITMPKGVETIHRSVSNCGSLYTPDLYSWNVVDEASMAQTTGPEYARTSSKLVSFPAHESDIK
jgi:hypothetical protein